MRTFLDEPLSLLTSILSVPVSVQYRFRATQSTATPSGCLTSKATITCTSKQENTHVVFCFFCCKNLAFYRENCTSIPVPSILALLISRFSSSLQYTKLSTGSKSIATACRIPETGITMSVRSGVSSEMRRTSTFLASNRKWTGPAIKIKVSTL